MSKFDRSVVMNLKSIHILFVFDVETIGVSFESSSNIWEKANPTLAGNLNSGLSYQSAVHYKGGKL